MKSFLGKSALFFLVALMMLGCSCESKDYKGHPVAGTTGKPKIIERGQPKVKPVETRPAAVEEKPKVQPVVEKPGGPSSVVAEIGDYVITRGELERRLIPELRAHPDEYIKENGTVDAEALLLKMIAKKAMIMEGRKQKLLEEPLTKSRLKRFRDSRLANDLLRKELPVKIKVSESEIDEKIKSNPKWSRSRAKVMIEREKAGKLVEQYYEQLYVKLHVKKLKANFSKAAKIYKRLLLHPKEPQKLRFVRGKQVEEELTPEEKGLVLATFDGGKVTLQDWFERLCLHAPPSRPKDLYTAKGAEKFLDRVLKLPVFVAEAQSQGLDKNEDFLKQVRNLEDGILERMVVNRKYKEAKRPAKEELEPYFNKNKDKFKRPATVKIDEIWCADLKTAQKVKEELSGGKDFKSVKEEYSLSKKEKPLNVSANREGNFFKELWNSEPNKIVGPMKGFYLDRKKRLTQVKWRVVKILGKKPSKAREYSSGIERDVRNKILSERREAVLAKYRKELLGKYPYKIYSERVKDIDPFDIP